MAFIMTMHKLTHNALLQALAACFVAVVGATERGTCAHLSAATTHLTTAATLLASALPAVQNSSVKQAVKAVSFVKSSPSFPNENYGD